MKMAVKHSLNANFRSQRKSDLRAIRFATAPCTVGYVLVAMSDRGVCAILLGDTKERLRDELAEAFPSSVLEAAENDMQVQMKAVVSFIEGHASAEVIDFDVAGTDFQRRVWRALCAIPEGTTRTYGDVARRVGSPSAARAVGRACAANPLAVAIPCHRVVRGDGAATEYRWGSVCKRTLLAREGTK
jgi:AraC family transcriptional regulator, regulatory protein of adaptative response / methylated-DNA-[protein]-cysteine methyltransferase